MKSVLSAVRSMADNCRLNESAAAGRNDRAELWGLEGAIPRRIGAATGSWDGRADGEGGDPAWHARLVPFSLPEALRETALRDPAERTVERARLTGTRPQR
jgi:hypothetical protein